MQCKFGARCEKGFCVCPTECPLSRDPVCGSDFLTYTNECELQKAACRLGHSLTVHFYGECVEGLVPHRAAGGTPTQPPPPASKSSHSQFGMVRVPRGAGGMPSRDTFITFRLLSQAPFSINVCSWCDHEQFV